MSMLAAAMSNLEQAFPDGIEYGTDQVAKILSGMTEEQGVIKSKDGKQMAVTKDTLISAGAKEKQVSKINKDNRVYVYDKNASGKETYKGLREFGSFDKSGQIDSNKELVTFTSLMMKLGVGVEDATASMKAMYEAGKIDKNFAEEKGWIKDGKFSEAEFASSFDSISERIEEPILSINDAVLAIANKICGENWNQEEGNSTSDESKPKSAEQMQDEHRAETGKQLYEWLKNKNFD